MSFLPENIRSSDYFNMNLSYYQVVVLALYDAILTETRNKDKIIVPKIWLKNFVPKLPNSLILLAYVVKVFNRFYQSEGLLLVAESFEFRTIESDLKTDRKNIIKLLNYLDKADLIRFEVKKELVIIEPIFSSIYDISLAE